jgi:prevent-host-death family protein
MSKKVLTTSAATTSYGPRRPILSEDVISFTECRGKLGEYFEKTRRTHRPIVVTQNGKPTSVIVSIADWEPLSNSWETEQRIAEQVLADLRTSEEQFARGEFHSNEEVFGMMRKKYEALLSARGTSA